jgi:hypothetical protein
VDRQENFFWFLGQSLTGPIALGTDYVHQTRFKGYDPQSVDQNIRNTDDLDRAVRRSARVNETRIIKERDIEVSEKKGNQAPGAPPKPKTYAKVRLPTFRPAQPGESPPNVTSVGRVNELGTLFCTVAGFMNLICILDAGQLRRRERGGAAAAKGGVGT